MPSEDLLLSTPPAAWATLPELERRRELYEESDPYDVVRWEVLVMHGKRGQCDRFRFILFSPQYDALVGVGHKEMSGKTPFEALSEPDAIKICHQYEMAVQCAEQVSYPEFLSIGGHRRWWRTRVKPLHTKDGRVWKLVCWSELIISTEADLRTAISRRQLEVHYQPIAILSESCMDCAANGDCWAKPHCIVGYEALIRWPGSGRTPDDFLPIAKAAGVMESITDFVIESAVGALQRLDERLWVSINISNCLFEETLERLVQKAGIDPARLRIEITEDTDLTPTTIARLRYVRWIGHLLELDDFGAQSSGFGWIEKTGAIAIKIDRQFVTRAYLSPNKAAICRAMIRAAKDYDPPLEVIVEGIETVEDLRFMRSLGADYGQGWGLGKPTPLGQ
jgi:EAL domain-containing protein (putative c-di-GMP-specific phosphodiesterase class I)